MKKNIFNLSKYCNNCGKHGHTQHECVLPIISIGIILFRIINNEIQYLLIRRKETFGYCDYVKNKSKNYNRTFLKNVIDEMTIKEKEYIKSKFTDTLTQELIDTSETCWLEPEWGFPKGRRNNGEKDLDCGLREFQEETGYRLSDIQLIENINLSKLFSVWWTVFFSHLIFSDSIFFVISKQFPSATGSSNSILTAPFSQKIFSVNRFL